MTCYSDHYVLICSTCQGTMPAEAAQDALDAQLPDGFETRMVACMAGCERAMTVGFQAAGKAQYLFGDIKTSHDLDALVEFATQFGDSDDGWTSASDRPPALFAKTLSRIPALPSRGTS
ncbi:MULTISPECIES: DUF1636 domain-containing protein [Ruegeria]|uniref:DUF1636 family protein n=1 Tax=Ruegeria TaxID=97050 RepID=UPI00147EE4B3|nr:MULTISPECIES: DUF1636 domain-containing protein [Ruegeria]NOE24765.1 DUF1636 domain-containing protein [Ruegeria sp. HKCCD6157]UUV07945.1 DUF1636 domain-containing protein [Ruegeria sp. YS9]